MQPRALTEEQRMQYMDALYSCISYSNAPYLAPILVWLKPLSVPGLGTLASDAQGHVFIDFDFLESENIGMEDLGRLVQHEAWHVAYGHNQLSDLYDPHYDPGLVTIAMDLVVNQHIPHIEEGWTGKTAVLPGKGDFSDLPEHLTWRKYLKKIGEWHPLVPLSGDKEEEESKQGKKKDKEKKPGSPQEENPDKEDDTDQDSDADSSKKDSDQDSDGDSSKKDSDQDKDQSNSEEKTEKDPSGEGEDQGDDQEGDSPSEDPSGTGKGKDQEGEDSETDQASPRKGKSHKKNSDGKGESSSAGKGTSSSKPQKRPNDQPSEGGNGGSGSSGNQPVTCGRSKLTKELIEAAQELDPGFEEGSMEHVIAIRETAEQITKFAESNYRWGQSHRELIGWAEAQLAPSIVPWKRRLSRVLGTKIGNSRPRFDYTWRKPSRRQSCGVGKPYYPAFKGDTKFEPNIVIGIDVSGSMSRGNTIDHVTGEIDGILRSHTIRSAYAFFVDVQPGELQAADNTAKVIKSGKTSLVRFSRVKNIKQYLFSGGGTDMRKALKAASELRGKLRPNIFILITDCETPWLEEEPAGLKRVETILLAVNTNISSITSSQEVCRQFNIPEWLSKAVIPIPAES